jgi:hypothetical protein
VGFGGHELCVPSSPVMSLFFALAAAPMAMKARSVQATAAEHERLLPGDDLIVNPAGSLTHAITIRASRGEVWPWLAQMGAGRAGWYSYDMLDNGGRPSATAILPWFQHIARGTLFPGLPGATDGFVVFACEPNRYLVLGWPSPQGEPLVTWTFALEELRPGVTRLVVRARGSKDYPFFGLPPAIGKPVVRLVHFVMERKQLLGIAMRAKRSNAVAETAADERQPERGGGACRIASCVE